MTDTFSALWYLGVLVMIVWGFGRFISALASSNLGRFLLVILGLSVFFGNDDDDMEL